MIQQEKFNETVINLTHYVGDDEFCKNGYFFHVFNEDFYFEVTECKKDHNCRIQIHHAPIPDIQISNLAKVKFLKYESELLYTINIWGKYYFVKFEEKHEEGYQLYHDENAIDVMAEVLKAALKFGIQLAGIKLY